MDGGVGIALPHIVLRRYALLFHLYKTVNASLQLALCKTHSCSRVCYLTQADLPYQNV